METDFLIPPGNNNNQNIFLNHEDSPMMSEGASNRSSASKLTSRNISRQSLSTLNSAKGLIIQGPKGRLMHGNPKRFKEED